MSDQLDPLVCARFKGDPGLTQTVRFSKLFESAQGHLPVDKVFAVLEGGSGFSLRELGTLVVQFIPASESVAPYSAPPAVEPPPPPSASPQKPEIVQDAPGSTISVPEVVEAQPKPKRKPRTKAPAKKQLSQPNAVPESPGLGLPSLPSKAVTSRVGFGSISTDGFVPANSKAEKEADMFGKIKGY